VKWAPRQALAFIGGACLLAAQGPDNVLVVVNSSSPLSKTVGEYYARQRHIPARNICRIATPPVEVVSRDVYDSAIARPVSSFLRQRGLTQSTLYIVTTSGVPLRIRDTGEGMRTRRAAVDSELTLLYSDILRRSPHRLEGPLPNPFYGQTKSAFRHPDFPIYLVTRLAGYDFHDIRGLIDRALAAANRGKFVIDLKAGDETPGNDWLALAAQALPKDRVILDESGSVLQNVPDVIAYASWGSNDHARKTRYVGMRWLPGAIMTEFVSTNGRTFERPPDSWQIGTWKDRKTWFADSPQTLTADYIHEGATGASGHVDEPFLAFTPRPDFLLPAYYKGRNLAESYYLAIPALSWQNIVIGDPLCSLGKPK
jgi:uncharacterized protein (TIGR03790 family)